VTQPVRSGQRIYAQRRDLLVLAPTSRGAELIADGSIYAFGLLRGRALAGAGGDKGARIVATRLDAELVAVAGVYRTLEAADIAELGDGAVTVALTFDEEGSERLVLRLV
jgi:septum site-determining protein MinC